MAGAGKNGGDALVAVRHLLNWNFKVDVVLATSIAKLKPVTRRQWKILGAMGIRQKKMVNGSYGLIIDGLLGFNAKGNPRDNYATLIEAANDSKIPILAVDLPSGLDATTGKAYEPCIKATATICLAALKTGLVPKSSKKYVGKILLAYMGVPEVVAKRFGLKNFFSERTLINQLL